jgi:hypothetical protein
LSEILSLNKLPHQLPEIPHHEPNSLEFGILSPNHSGCDLKGFSRPGVVLDLQKQGTSLGGGDRRVFSLQVGATVVTRDIGDFEAIRQVIDCDFRDIVETLVPQE